MIRVITISITNSQVMNKEIKFEEQIYKKTRTYKSNPIINLTFKLTFGLIKTERQASVFLSVIIFLCLVAIFLVIKRNFFPVPPHIILPFDKNLL